MTSRCRCAGTASTFAWRPRRRRARSRAGAGRCHRRHRRRASRTGFSSVNPLVERLPGATRRTCSPSGTCCSSRARPASGSSCSTTTAPATRPASPRCCSIAAARSSSSRRWPTLFPSTLTTLDMAHLYGRLLGKGLAYRLNAWAARRWRHRHGLEPLHRRHRDARRSRDVRPGYRPQSTRRPLLGAQGRGRALHRIGDCHAPRKLDHAIYEGYLAGRELWSPEHRYIYEGELECTEAGYTSRSSRPPRPRTSRGRLTRTVRGPLEALDQRGLSATPPCIGGRVGGGNRAVPAPALAHGYVSSNVMLTLAVTCCAPASTGPATRVHRCSLLEHRHRRRSAALGDRGPRAERSARGARRAPVHATRASLIAAASALRYSFAWSATDEPWAGHLVGPASTAARSWPPSGRRRRRGNDVRCGVAVRLPVLAEYLGEQDRQRADVPATCGPDRIDHLPHLARVGRERSLSRSAPWLSTPRERAAGVGAVRPSRFR